MTNIVATGISSKLTAAEKTAVRTNIDVEKGVRDYNAYIESIFTKATLDLNFTKNEHKVYEAFGLTNKVITDAITTARNSTALYQSPTALASAAINIPRIEYDSATGASLGLLAEEQRTNLLLHSQYTAASGETPPTGWTIFSSTGVTTTATSPRFAGAIRAIQSGTAQRECYVQTLSLLAGTTYTFSAYFAAGTSADNIILRVRPASGDTPTGTLTLPASAVTTAGTYSVTFTTASGGSYEFYVGLGCSANATGTVIHETPQLEVGPTFTSYIPTTTAQVTRLADLISRALTTTNANAGAIFIEFDMLSAIPAGLFTTVVKITDGANAGNRGFALRLSENTFAAVIRGDTDIASSGVAVSDAATPKKALVSFDNNAKKLLIAIDGIFNEITIAAAVDISAYASHIFVAGASSISGVGTIHSKTVKRCTYFPRSFSAAEAQAITA